MRGKRAVQTASRPKLASLNSRPKKAIKQRSSGAARKPTTVVKNKKIGKLPTPVLSESQNLRCRYCGSNDLAPSFKRRHDARCRTCFKQRYGSASRKKG